jgi:hypothetical protein
MTTEPTDWDVIRALIFDEIGEDNDDPQFLDTMDLAPIPPRTTEEDG